MTTQENNILDRKINWLTARVLITFTVGIITVTAGGYKAYSDIIGAIKDVGYNNRIQDVQIQAMQVQIDKMEIEIKEIKEKLK